MFIVRLLRFLKGYVKFVITGAFPERFLNLCARNRVPIWGVRPHSRGYEACTCLKSYYRLRPLARQSKTRLRVRERHGLPFFANRYQKRWGIIAGFVAACVFILFMSQCIWSVEVQGAETIEPESLISRLEGFGLKPGVRARSLNVRELEQKMMLAEDRLSWIAINISGSRAVVEIKERVAPPAVVDKEKAAANVVASEDGQIKSMEVYEGQPLLRAGDTVSKGEVIVSGVIEDGHGNTGLRYARAKVIAWVYDDMTEEQPLHFTEWVETGETVTARQLKVFGVTIPLGWGGKAEGEYSAAAESKLIWNFPQIDLITTQKKPLQQVKRDLTETEAKELALASLEKRELEQFTDGTVVDRKLEGKCENGVFTVKAHYTVEKDIAKELEIMTN